MTTPSDTGSTPGPKPGLMTGRGVPEPGPPVAAAGITPFTTAFITCGDSLAIEAAMRMSHGVIQRLLDALPATMDNRMLRANANAAVGSMHRAAALLPFKAPPARGGAQNRRSTP